MSWNMKVPVLACNRIIANILVLCVLEFGGIADGSQGIMSGARGGGITPLVNAPPHPKSPTSLVGLVISGTTTFPDGSLHIVIGQQLIITVAFDPTLVNVTDFNWTGPDFDCDPFTNFVANQWQASYTAFPRPYPQIATMSCYFASPGTVNISCTCNVNGEPYTMPAPPIVVEAPKITLVNEAIGKFEVCDLTNSAENSGSVSAHSANSPYYINAKNGPEFIPNFCGLYDATSMFGSVWGRFLDIRVADPPNYPGPGGTYCFVQTLDRTTTDAGLISNVAMGLDSTFPYGSAWWAEKNGEFTESSADFVPADGNSIGEFNDAPGLILPRLASPSSYDGMFVVTVLYLPPGQGGVYVPIYYSDWVAEGTLTTPNSTSPNVWTWTDDGSKVQSDGSAYDDFPYW